MKRLYLLLLITAVLASCSIGPISVYNFRPIIRIECDTTEITFRVPDLDPDGWWNGDGTDSKEIALTLKETAGADAFITDIQYQIVASDNDIITGDLIKLISPIEINKTSDTYDLDLILEEIDAIQIDEADGIQDNVGTGTVIITVHYYDEYAGTYTSVPAYIPFRVIKP